MLNARCRVVGGFDGGRAGVVIVWYVKWYGVMNPKNREYHGTMSSITLWWNVAVDIQTTTTSKQAINKSNNQSIK